MCDAPAERPTTLEGLLHQARAERLLPGEGGLDLRGILRAVPGDTPISIEIPQEALAKTVPAVERARRALQATHRLLQSLH
jgi:sugar phosphate isomerase/epimerase